MAELFGLVCAASPATKGAVLGTAATQGVYTELYEKLHSTFSTSLISFEQDKFSLLRKSCFKVRSSPGFC
jgi:hypothetical protein